MAESDKCAFCQTEVESIEPLLFSCKISSAKYPKHVLSWLRDNNIIVESLKGEDIIIGKFDVGDDFLLESYFIAWEVLYLFTKGQKGMPSLRGFITRTRCVYNIELYIARKRGTLNKHLSKWEKLINIM